MNECSWNLNKIVKIAIRHFLVFNKMNNRRLIVAKIEAFPV